MFSVHKIIMRCNSLLIEFIMPLFNKKIHIGKGLRVRKNVALNCNGGELYIGDGVFINSNSSINVQEKITIGNQCLLGENVHIYDHNHRFSDVNKSVATQGFKCAPVCIGNNVWIGSNVVILAGVSIGDNCVIGANCLIYKSVPDNMIVKCSQNLIFEERNIE